MVPQKGLFEGRKAFRRPFWGTKKKCENENLCHFSRLYGIGTKSKTVFLSNYRLMSFRFLNTRDTNLKCKNKTSLLTHYFNLFSTPNFGIRFNIIVLQYAPKYYQKPPGRYLVYFANRSLYVGPSPIIRMITGINTL